MIVVAFVIIKGEAKSEYLYKILKYADITLRRGGACSLVHGEWGSLGLAALAYIIHAFYIRI